MTQAYPLHWPAGHERTDNRKPSRFESSLAASRDDLLKQIKLLGGEQVVISSNAKLRNDGLPYSTQPRVTDPGVAVYFTYAGEQVVFACDKWTEIGENIRALGLAIEAIRGLARWGVSDMLKRAFSGFKALPQAVDSADAWWIVLEVNPGASLAEIKQAYRRLVKQHHPDNLEEGNTAQFQRIQQAYEDALKSPEQVVT